MGAGRNPHSAAGSNNNGEHVCDRPSSASLPSLRLQKIKWIPSEPLPYRPGNGGAQREILPSVVLLVVGQPTVEPRLDSRSCSLVSVTSLAADRIGVVPVSTVLSTKYGPLLQAWCLHPGPQLCSFPGFPTTDPLRHRALRPGSLTQRKGLLCRPVILTMQETEAGGLQIQGPAQTTE